MRLLADLGWGLLYAVLAYAGGIAGILAGDARARRRGEPLDGGMAPLMPGDQGYYTGVRWLDGPDSRA